jgi:HK97 gp10 family phage protein
MSKPINVKGLDELQKIMDTLPGKIQGNVMRGALRAGMTVVKRRAQDIVRKESGDTARALKVGTKIERVLGTAVVKSKLAAQGFEGYMAMWLEFGTNRHLISVSDEEKNVNARLSRKLGQTVKESMSTVNRRVLAIGQTFVGPVVQHPGARAFPFMRPALDAEAQRAVIAVGEYIKKRLATKHGIDTSHIMIEGDE